MPHGLPGRLRKLKDKRKAYDTLTFRVDEGYAPAQPYITSLRNEVLMSSDWGRDIYLGKYFNADPDVASHIEWLVIKREEGMALVVSESAQEYLPFSMRAYTKALQGNKR